ncbi:MAG: hypothetical protein ACFFCS_28690 [Candidatus Hodarchaeota archaeon]
MSFIPKYILKRMCPKDCARAVEGGTELTLINVISPLSIDEMPDDLENHFEVHVDGEPLSKDILEKCRITVNDKEYTLKNAKEFEKELIPVGGIVKAFAPLTHLKPGEEHSVRLKLSLMGADIDVEITRVIQ